VWEGKAGNYSVEVRVLAMALLFGLDRQGGFSGAREPESAINCGKPHLNLALGEILYKNTVCSYKQPDHR
jgi:hypothetical protein